MYPSQTEDNDNFGIKSTKKPPESSVEKKIPIKLVFATLRTLV